MASSYAKRANIQVATDASMASEIRNAGTETRAAVRDLIDVRIGESPAVVAAAAAQVQAQLAAQSIPRKLLWKGQGQGSLTPLRGGVTYDPNGGPFGNGAVRQTTAGTASAVSLSAALAEPSGDTTITAWIRLAAIPTGQNRVACAAGGTRVYIGAQAGTGNVIFSAADTAFTTSIPIADGAWHFVEGAFSRTAGVTKPAALHVDGVAVTVPAGQSSQAWDSTFSVLGFNGAFSQFDWPGEVGVVEIFTGQRTSFEVPGSANNGGARSLLLARMSSSNVFLGSMGYPARPAAAPPGMVEYQGPVQPTTWLERDRWVKEWV